MPHLLTRDCECTQTHFGVTLSHFCGSCLQKMTWIVNEGPKWLILTVWFGIDWMIFTLAYLRYEDGQDYYYLRLFTGKALAIARASAASLNYNCMLILLPVCRNLISFLRGSCTCCRRNFRRQFDKNLTFHKCVAYAICLQTAIHVAAHCFNFERLIKGHDNPDSGNRQLLAALSSLPTTPNGTYINPIRDGSTVGAIELFKFISGVSGAVITLCLIVMVSSATEVIRRSYFEVFWFTHHLFVIFFAGLVIHGIQGIVRAQTNMDVHDHEKCRDKFDSWGQGDCPVPQFGNPGAKTWMWVVGPMAIYFLERCIRVIRNWQSVIITKVVKRPSNVMELQMKKKGFRMQPGQYVFLKCPQISRLEWHPFTLTSAPNEDHITVHIRCVGDWTKALAKACHVGETDNEVQQASSLPTIAIDGPFGTASEDIFQYQVDVFVAAGIGVTPFASVLKDIWYKYCESPSQELKLKKVYFYWICPDTMAFEWIQDLLHSLELQMREQGKTGFLIYNIYLTRGWDANQAKNIMLHNDAEQDAITGLEQKTYFGRPNWEQVFSTLAQEHKGTSIGVFFCGPKELSKTLHKYSNQFSSHEPSGTHFYYNKENF